MGLLSYLRRERTKEIGSILMQIESFVSYQCAAALNQVGTDCNVLDVGRTEQAGPNSYDVARVNAQHARSLASGVLHIPLREWPIVYLNVAHRELIGVVIAAVEKALAYRGSSKGMTPEGGALVESHFKCLAEVKGLLVAAISGLEAGSERDCVRSLASACDALDAQLTRTRGFAS